MRSVRVHRARQLVPWIAAVATFAGSGQDDATQLVRLPGYHPPVIAIAQPAAGVALLDDRPVVVLRFASEEPLDPIDALSFALSVDGEDRTALFQLAGEEAWGPLSPAGAPLAAGQHDVRARICTVHGACGSTRATIAVVPASPATAVATRDPAARRRRRERLLEWGVQALRVLDAVLQAVRALFR